MKNVANNLKIRENVWHSKQRKMGVLSSIEGRKCAADSVIS